MKPRKLALGDRNLIGARVTEARNLRGMKQVELLARLQTAGIDISIPALSLLEGQKRPVSDIELKRTRGYPRSLCRLAAGTRGKLTLGLQHFALQAGD